MAVKSNARATPSKIGAEEGAALWSVGALVTVKLGPEETGGAFSLVEHLADPGFETPYHVHHGEDELFYVLTGEIECRYGDDGEHVVRAGPDETVYLPRDLPHGFRVVSDEPCRMLIQVTPSGLEAFFTDVGMPAERLETPPPAEPDVAMLTERAAGYDLEILGPLPN
ncbi:cupin domain-containing protein [Halomarina rubra]|uniref:Cupin domain-containing protein n=1 Tax=Halomarina rubra TaxID=2071873 RepID=A0ABD6B1C1_9EURY|nr:cupin domain-containing protein [Halomarina rubra]